MGAMRNDPVIEKVERTGWPRGSEPRSYRCPNCGSVLTESEMLYIRDDGEILGCGVCVFGAYADEALGIND